MKRLAGGTTFLAIWLLAASGCERTPDTPVASPAGTTATISSADAAGATYASENTGNGRLSLKNGEYVDDDGVAATLEDISVAGDLDGDGTEERVVILATSTGGSGLFRDLYVLRRQDGQVRASAPGALGDRVVVNDLRIEQGTIVVDLLVQGEADPLCCPSQRVTYRFRPAGNDLPEISGNRRVYLKM